LVGTDDDAVGARERGADDVAEFLGRRFLAHGKSETAIGGIELGKRPG